MATAKKRTAMSGVKSSKKMRDSGKTTIVIKTCNNEAEAEITRGLLSAAGIKAFIAKDDVGGMYPSLQATGSGVSVCVRQKDVSKAKQIVQGTKKVTGRVSDNLPSNNVKSMLSSVPWLVFFLGFVVILLLDFQVQLTLIYIGALLGMTGVALEILGRREKKKKSKQSKPRITASKRNYFIVGVAIGVMIASSISFFNVSEQTPQDGIYEYDNNKDGKVDVWQTYNKNGSIVKIASDRNFDGKPDSWWEYKNSLLVLGKADNDFNDKPDVTYYFEDGVLSIAVFQPNEAKIIHKKQIFRDGVLREEWIDKDLNGTFDERIICDLLETPVQTIPIRGF
jgi:hypothetical protein